MGLRRNFTVDNGRPDFTFNVGFSNVFNDFIDTMTLTNSGNVIIHNDLLLGGG